MNQCVTAADSLKPVGGLNGYMRGKINLFSLDALVNMAVAAGLHVELQVRHAA